MNGKVGFALIIYDNTGNIIEVIKERLPDSCSIFQAELCTLRIGVSWVAEFWRGQDANVALVSDSSSALHSISHCTYENWDARDAYIDLVELNKQGIVCDLFWVKAHAGDPGNEEADRAAQLATSLANISVQRPLPRSHSELIMKSGVSSKWQDVWETSTKSGRLHSYIKYVKDNYIYGDFYLNQILTGHGDFNAYLVRFKRADEANCRFCSLLEDEDADHVLWRCLHPASLVFELILSAS